MQTRQSLSAQLTAAAILSIALFPAGCSNSPGASHMTQPSVQPRPGSRPDPVQPVVTSVSPDVGSTGGGTPTVITGTGFQAGMTVTFDSTAVPLRFDSRYTDRVFFDTPPHPAGTVDVVVTNPYAEPARLAAGYRYAPPDSFDFNGTWSGYPLDGSDLSLAFTIRNDRLMSVSCGDTALELGDGVPVKGGEFSFVQSGAAMTGKIVSASQAVGTIDLAPCHAPLWEAAQAR